MPDGFWLGVAAVPAAIGALVIVGGLIWLVVIMVPEGIWWTVKRLPLGDDWSRELAAALIGSARRAYTLRIPFGVRLTLTLGESGEGKDQVLRQLHLGRKAASRSVEEA
ncbi:hypothetical protein AB0B94_31255 [Micromonospora sp. NPDC048986]|uniref:hypothetical protein n=1 Tax=Micromonospora sp. NPDC048986 TaxID=3155644 RepID=UPI0033F53788